EIESALARHPGVREAVVLASAEGSEDRRLVAYVVPERGERGETGAPREAPSLRELRAWAGDALPDYMLPGGLVVCESLPLTPSGKVDRRALGRLQATPPGEGGAVAPMPPLSPMPSMPPMPAIPPRTALERRLAALFAETLGVAALGVHDDFFELGGNSIRGAVLINRLQEELEEIVHVVAIFDMPTVAALAGYLTAQHPQAVARLWGGEPPEEESGPERPKPAPRVAAEGVALLRSQPVSREGALPLSFAQERLWFLDRLEPGSAAYNVFNGLRLVGRLAVPALEESLSEVVRRHAVLRTTLGIAGGLPTQIIAAELRPEFPLVDLRALAPARREREARRLADAEAARPFDLARGPLLRAALLRLSPDEHAVLFTLHHVIADGWSMGLLVREVAALYGAFVSGLPSPLPELPLQYTDYALWQRRWLSGAVLAEQLSYWRGQLSGAPTVLDLPTDRPRPAVQSFRGATLASPLPSGQELEGLARRQGATLYMVLLAGFETLLYRITGQDRLLVGSTHANRNRREIENLIGFFVNTLVMRADFTAATTWSELLGRTRESVLGAFAHQDVPFERLVEELEPARDPSRTPIVQVVMQLQNARASSLALPGLAISPLAVTGRTAKFDLVVNFAEGESGLESEWHYRTDLFDRATVARLSGQLGRLLASAAEPSDRRLADLALLSAAERHQLVCEWNEGAMAPMAAMAPKQPMLGSLYERFAVQAAARPAAVAVVSAGERLSYGELARHAERLAGHLAALGVGRGDRVGLLLARSPRLPAAILAVLRAGAAYVPLDPAYPVDRLTFMLADSGARVLVTEAALLSVLTSPEGLAVVVLESLEAGLLDRRGAAAGGGAGSADLAYVIYTSGSTGRPKGVGVTHGNAVRLFTATEGWFGFGPADAWTLFHSYAFDFSVWELWGALAYGGRLVIVPYEVSRTPPAFRDLLAQEGVTVLNQTPSAFRQLLWAEESALSRGEPKLPLRWVIFGGEALEPGSLEPWFARYGEAGPCLVNMYGITETTVHVTYRRLSRRDLVSGSVVGRALPDLAVYVVGGAGSPAPLGVPGEIQVGGAGVSAGYLGRPELTAERFVPDPFGGAAGARLYRSGDLARWLAGGELEYLGRIDHQVKVRGFRIELGEIESALARHPGVREAVVLASAEGSEDRRLVAYVVPERGERGE
ncbi:MAG TPA: amino acid adenylation domain-containing protein, partial [Thermoanaerobaculia bacterium]|nr:amino acid adenylation domain-containing protein [Thermoanaerobaculia bacterium]